MRFKNRQEAGQQLAEGVRGVLANHPGETTIIYALPRGGVVLGAEIAKRLHLPLDLIITRKIGHPQNPEYAICAVAEDGDYLCNPTEQALVDQDWLEAEFEKEKKEAQRRRITYLGEEEALSPEGKIAIIVDDGIATGLTMWLAINEMKHYLPKRIIVAVPVVPPDTAERLRVEVDGLVTLDIPELYLGGVGAYYDNFDQVTDQEVIQLLKKANEISLSS